MIIESYWYYANWYHRLLRKKTYHHKLQSGWYKYCPNKSWKAITQIEYVEHKK